MEDPVQPHTPRSSVADDTKTTAQVTGRTAATDSEPAPQVRSNAKRVDKRSVDYVLRSGFAGGLAGCAVS